jgi:hypothetical protein
MILSLAFAVLFSWWQDDKSGQPLVSASDPAFLACSFWNGHGWSKPATRSVRTPILESPKGFRAYAKVTAAVHGSSCGNTIKLYVRTEGDGEFKIVYRKGDSENEGYGIRLVGWSPDGDKLLAEVNRWEYETDLRFDHRAFIYNANTGAMKEIKGLGEALSHHFGSDCEFEFSADRWKNNDQVLVKISKAFEDESYEQHFCVEQPVILLFDLQKGTLQPTPSRRQDRNRKTP